MLKIGEFSKLSSITIKMLRHYDEINLLKPEKMNDQTGYRYYSAKQLSQANKIGIYKALGFSLKEIKEILSAEDDQQVVAAYFKERESALQAEKQQLDEKIAFFHQLSDQQLQLEKIRYHVVYKKFPVKRMLTYRRKVKDYGEEGMLWSVLYDYLAEAHITPIDKGIVGTVYHDDEYAEGNIDMEVMVEVSEKYPTAKGFSCYEWQPGEVASVTFNGEFSQMPQIAKAVGGWLEGKDYEIKGGMFNVYHVSSAVEKNPENWITEACYRLAKKR